MEKAERRVGHKIVPLDAKKRFSLQPSLSRSSKTEMPQDYVALKAKRIAMAKVFADTQQSMASTVDLLALKKKSAIPYPSTWEGESISKTGPVPTDAHLIPSGYLVIMGKRGGFKKYMEGGKPMGLSGTPYYAYAPPQPDVFKPGASSEPFYVEPEEKRRTGEEQEIWRTRFQEWTLQKNAYNPDIAAAMRTNVKKQAEMSLVETDKEPDPARTSENVRLALSFSEMTGPAPPRPKKRLEMSAYLPTYL